MPRFICEATFDLTTTVEFDGYGSEFENLVDGIDGASDIDVSIGNDSADVTTSYNSVSVTIDAEDEDEAESLVQDALEGQEIEDNNGFTWVTESVSVEVTKVEMTEDEARTVVAKFLAIQRALLNVDDETNEAFAILLDM